MIPSHRNPLSHQGKGHVKSKSEFFIFIPVDWLLVVGIGKRIAKNRHVFVPEVIGKIVGEQVIDFFGNNGFGELFMDEGGGTLPGLKPGNAALSR